MRLEVFTYGSAISCCEKASRWHEALALLRGDVNAYAFSGAISVPWMTLIFKMNHNEFVMLIRLVLSEFGVAFQACKRAGEWQLALALLDMMDLREAHLVDHRRLLKPGGGRCRVR